MATENSTSVPLTEQTTFTPNNSNALKNSRTTEIPSNDAQPNLCFNSKLDAITALDDGSIYAFKGDYVYRIDPSGGGVLDRFTEKSSYVFHGLPGNINAALTYGNKTFFFKDEYYWRYVDRKLDGDFPKLIAVDFPGIPDHLDAAFRWSGDDKMYFLKGDKYWRFDHLEKPPVAINYPLPFSQWHGLPTKDIDAAFSTPNGPLYFFKDDNYWLFDDDNFQVAVAEPPYPRSTKVMWFGCTTYRPDVNELKRGWIKRTVERIKKVVLGIKTHFDKKIKILTRWLF